MKPLAVFLPGEKKQAAYRFNRAAFTPDKSAHIVRRDANLDADAFTVTVFVNLDRVGRAHQRFHDSFDRILHFKKNDKPVLTPPL